MVMCSVNYEEFGSWQEVCEYFKAEKYLKDFPHYKELEKKIRESKSVDDNEIFSLVMDEIEKEEGETFIVGDLILPEINEKVISYGEPDNNTWGMHQITWLKE